MSSPCWFSIISRWRHNPSLRPALLRLKLREPETCPRRQLEIFLRALRNARQFGVVHFLGTEALRWQGNERKEEVGFSGSRDEDPHTETLFETTPHATTRLQSVHIRNSFEGRIAQHK